MDALAGWLEDDCHDGCRHQRQDEIWLAARAGERTDAHDHADVGNGDADPEATIDQGPTDEQVDVVQPVSKDRHRHRRDERSQPDQIRHAQERNEK